MPYTQRNADSIAAYIGKPGLHQWEATFSRTSLGCLRPGLFSNVLVKKEPDIYHPSGFYVYATVSAR